MKPGQGKRDALTWSDIREISKQANNLSTLLPDAGRSSQTQLAQLDSALPTSRVRGSRGADREASHLAPSVGNPFSSPTFSE